MPKREKTGTTRAYNRCSTYGATDDESSGKYSS